MTPDQIRTTRTALGLTQSEFASLVGVSRTYVGQIERGEKTPDRATARLLAVLDVPGVVDRLRAVTPQP